MPTARQPLILASWPTTLPTAPEAAETTTVSPALGWQISSRPTHAVTPGIPSTPRYAESGTRLASTLLSPLPSDTPYCCQPNMPSTVSPVANLAFFDSTTSPTVPPIITSPSSCLAAYDLPSFIRPRMYGSSESQRFFTSTSPSRSGGSGTLSIRKLSSLTHPEGRLARSTRLFSTGREV